MKQTKNGIRTDTFALFANASFARSGARYLFFFVSAIILLSPSLHAAQDWAWFDHFVQFGSGADDRAISWALRQYIERERKQQEAQDRRSAAERKGAVDESS